MQTDRQKPKKKPLQDYTKFSGIAFQMIAVILLGVWGGVKLDKYIPFSFPIFTFSFTILSVFLSIYIVIREVNNR